MHNCKNHKEINSLLYRKKYDVFYSALPYSYFDLNIPPETKFIYTIHGLRVLEQAIDKFAIKYKKINLKTITKHFISLIFPLIWKKFKSRNIQYLNKLFSLTKNQIIITDSNHSKFSISYFFPFYNINKIKVLYPPLKDIEHYTNSNSNIMELLAIQPNKYILLISGNRSEKGAYRACKVLSHLINKNNNIFQEMKILVLGVSYYKEYRKIIKHNDQFIFYNYVSTEDLETLYKNAFLFLYPTLNEGFGYPPLEAMKYGTLCACSANSAVPEVCSDAVLYFNPFDEIEMSIRILQSFDEEIRKEKIQKINTRVKVVKEKQEQDLKKLIEILISQ